MGKIVGFHPVELRPGADAAELERLVRDDLAPIYQQLRQTVYLMKGDRGAYAGKYTVVIEIESAQERDRIYHVVDGELELSEDALRIFEQSEEIGEKLGALVVSFPSPEFTDYEVLD